MKFPELHYLTVEGKPHIPRDDEFTRKFCEILQIQPDLVTLIKLHMGVGEITKIYVERYATKAEMSELAGVLDETKGVPK